MNRKLSLLLILLILFRVNAQTEKENNEEKDSLYIHEVENVQTPLKILHAEPLYIDLIRDLGARKGEKEWNIGLGLVDNNKFDRYEALVEYEWAPIDRLGLEVELPFTMYSSSDSPGSKLNGIKLAAQYTFLVSEQYNTSLALGYIHEFEITEFDHYGKGKFFTGNVFNPFLVAAKRWGSNFHSLIYTGPVVVSHFDSHHTDTSWQINTNFHYMITGTRNFIGVEFNKSIAASDFDMTIRPQMRVGITDNVMVGIVTGIPIKRENDRFSSFLRLIYEPKHKK
ncbi:phosphoribosylformylglycinamidine synthase [Chryseobacterium sp. 09-1422]|uniref:Phosphoribosylformylglycinamidine synthase n=1 Tax=Chryseobacterium kimseyorum TaxID=2984028 RepID=A0ABT3I181_9FLAO|nr:HAEPLYID family protein [Chryseobacterium kimseyorum]MCW3169830.1 phosphoribosylformylglycinamidine synthase [Chryseobacterium kimseyorum]